MQDDTVSAWVKIAIAWTGVVIGSVTLSQVVAVLTITFTTLQIYKLIRDIRRQNRADRVAEQAAASAAAVKAMMADVASPLPVVLVPPTE